MTKSSRILVGTRLFIDSLRTNFPALVATFFQSRSVKLPECNEPIQIQVSKQAVAKVSERFLSFSIDIAQVVGGKFWGDAGKVDWVPGGSHEVDVYHFNRPRLCQLVKNLAPAYLRIGGTAADETFYAVRDGLSTPPSPYKYILSRSQWDAVNRFAQEAELDVVFTLNAGRGPRGSRIRWNTENARELIEYSAERGYEVAAWSLGNEPNLFPAAHGLWLSMQQYAEEYARLKEIIKEIFPQAKLLGPSSAFWPGVGEFLPIFPRFLKEAGPVLDVITWHYYPQQSRRSPIATRRASESRMLFPGFLDETARWAAYVEDQRDRNAPQAEVWLEETSNAQCGGEPGLSDRFIATFWWLDTLGCLARTGQKVIIRQNLSGADYSLIDDTTLEPNPDYWSSFLWKRLMGRDVLDVHVSTQRPDLRVFAHRSEKGEPDSVTVLAMNLNREECLTLQFGKSVMNVYLSTAPEWMGQEVILNGYKLAIRSDGSPPELEPVIVTNGSLDLPPVSYAFIQFKLE